jgi:hypothetical protein
MVFFQNQLLNANFLRMTFNRLKWTDGRVSAGLDLKEPYFDHIIQNSLGYTVLRNKNKLVRRKGNHIE